MADTEAAGDQGQAPLIAAVICTHNRAKLLEHCLTSLLEQSLPPEQFEIIVIDNASQDETAAVVHRVGGEAVHYYYEPRVGLSYARNLALDKAAAPLIAYMDDDAEAEGDWLAMLLEAFDSPLGNKPACVGGAIRLNWQASRPGWLPDSSLATLGLVDHGPDARVCDFPSELLFGANLAFARLALLAQGGFDVRLGRMGKQLLSNEETAVIARIQAEGGLIYYEPRAVVRHLVPKERLSLGWFLHRTYDQGISDARMGRLRGGRRYQPGFEGGLRLWLNRLGTQPASQVAFLGLMSLVYRLGWASQLRLSPFGQER